MRKGVAIFAAIASLVALGSSIATGQTGIRKDGDGPSDCYSFDGAPEFGYIEHPNKPPEIPVMVSGQLTCASDHENLEARIYLWKQKQNGKWAVIDVDHRHSANSTVVNVEAYIRCLPAREKNHFWVSMWSKVDNHKPWVIKRYPIQRASRKVACPS
jgi:hypothetical protein